MYTKEQEAPAETKIGTKLPQEPLWRHNRKTGEAVFYNLLHFIAYHLAQLGFKFSVKQSCIMKDLGRGFWTGGPDQNASAALTKVWGHSAMPVLYATIGSYR
jgi:hypothetical protein